MATKQPVIRFSPFEALLIGEKNKILKQQPMKNTIFVTKLNQKSRSINLRDLFGLEKDHENSQDKKVVKIHQRVHDYVTNKKLKSKRHITTIHKNKKFLCYNFEGQKFTLKNHNQELKNKKIKSNSKKVKFKKKVKHKDSCNKNLSITFCNSTKKSRRYNLKNQNITPKAVLQGVKKRNLNTNRHLLRGKDGKFIRKSEYEKLILKSENIITKQKYVTNYLHHLYVNKNFFTNNMPFANENLNVFQVPYNSENIGGKTENHLISKKQFDLSISEIMLNKVSWKFYEKNFHEDFQFPKFPKDINFTDFEDDRNLLDIVYESLPKYIRFESTNNFDDFSDALKKSEILTFDKNLKIYEKKRNEIVSNDTVSLILNDHISCIDLEKPDVINITHSSIKHIRGGLPTTIDEPYTEKNHLISGKSLASLFFRSVEGKDIFIGNLFKPFWQNSWFGSLPEF